jgi:hypothetical protein
LPIRRETIAGCFKIAGNREVYLEDRRKLDRVDVKRFYTEESFRVVDYVAKSIKKGRLDYDNSVLVLPRASFRVSR